MCVRAYVYPYACARIAADLTAKLAALRGRAVPGEPDDVRVVAVDPATDEPSFVIGDIDTGVPKQSKRRKETDSRSTYLSNGH